MEDPRQMRGIKDPQALWNAMPNYERDALVKGDLGNKHWLLLTQEEQSAIVVAMEKKYCAERGYPVAEVRNPGDKEPWQMTREDFINYIKTMPRSYREALIGGEGRGLVLESSQTGKSVHQLLLEQALKEGKPVPPEVLADYPDLRTREGNPGEAVIVGIGSSVCDKYTGACGRIINISNEEVLIEPTIVRKKIDGYLEQREPPIRAKKKNLVPNHIKRYEKVEKGGNPMTDEEIDQVASKLVVKVLEETAPSVLDPGGMGMLIHFTEHEVEGAGLVVNEAKARATPCNCFTYKDREYCFSPGVIGMMSSRENPEQIIEFCAAGKTYEVKPGAKKRFASFADAAEAAHKKIEGIPKGEKLAPWLEAMSEELEKRGVEG